ncbi:hypothetical protein [Cumulibacter soli]|uniref:hypothetical protein n=1 Tax=Cumulibacter soli TaxID=2546344 RepID=UPI001067C7FC|nr:hypothetical protein [Cumulibacter soli]
MDISLNPLYDKDPCPRVEIEIQNAPSGALVTVYRLFGGSEMVVQNMRARAQSAFIGSDYAAPFGVDVEYRAEATVDGALVEAVAESTLIPDPHAQDYERGWLQLPLAPASAIEVYWAPGALQAFRYSGAEAVEASIGAGLPFGFGAPLSRMQDISLVWHALGVDAITAVEKILTTSRVVLVRTRDPIGTPAAMYVSLSDVTVRADDMDRDSEKRLRTWAGGCEVVRPPAASIAVPVFTYGSVNADYAGMTYGDVMALRPGATYLDWVRDPRP